MESIRLSDSIVHGQFFGHRELRLRSRPEDYGEMRVYSGSSSSGEMNPAKEETYHIACSLGAASNSRVIANVDHHTVGLLLGKIVADFTNAYLGSFTAPEVERDLLRVPNLSLVEAGNFHSLNVSDHAFSCICLVVIFLSNYGFMPCL